jgi:hypothetical protein
MKLRSSLAVATGKIMSEKKNLDKAGVLYLR